MTFDDRGRILDHRKRRVSAQARRAGARSREDSGGHATATAARNKVTVFADGLNIPTGVAVGYGGVWVLNAPDLLFLREKDGKEVSREVVFTGFGRTDTHELPNSLTWGPDGWLYGLNGVFNHSEIVDNNGKRHRFNCALWRYHPRTHEFQIVRRRHEQSVRPRVGHRRQRDRRSLPLGQRPSVSFCRDRPSTTARPARFRRSRCRSARSPITATRRRPIAGSCTSTPTRFRRSTASASASGNIHGGCLNVDRLTRDGATYLAKAEPDLLTANDAWFMPVSLKIGPDGCLYVLDWYDRYHCSQDAARDPAGVDRLKGRLYRLRYGDTPRAREVRPGRPRATIN